MMQSIKGAEISTAGFTDKTTKNNLDLVKWCENAYKNGWGYVYGGYGQICTKQYLDQQAICFPATTKQAVKCDRSERNGSARECAIA